MTSYPFIEELFKNVLRSSRSIEGRFFLSHKNGLEINSDTLGEVLTDSLTQLQQQQKYPLVLMLPPRAKGAVKFRTDEFQLYNLTTFWLKTTYYDSAGKVSSVNKNTLTSQHTVPQDWHDMKRCAESFLRVLDNLQRSTELVNYLRLTTEDKVFTPVSGIGTDRASGVRLDFAISLFSGCELEDYDENDISGIIIPDADNHPEHKL